LSFDFWVWRRTTCRFWARRCRHNTVYGRCLQCCSLKTQNSKRKTQNRLALCWE
jgi:hypothetical protein